MEKFRVFFDPASPKPRSLLEFTNKEGYLAVERVDKRKEVSRMPRWFPKVLEKEKSKALSLSSSCAFSFAFSFVFAFAFDFAFSLEREDEQEGLEEGHCAKNPPNGRF